MSALDFGLDVSGRTCCGLSGRLHRFGVLLSIRWNLMHWTDWVIP